jgi:hypothetical protein
MIRTVRLTSADVQIADALRTVDDKRGRPCDVERCEPEPMVDAVALDHRAVRIDEDRQGKTTRAAIVGHFLGALAGDDQDLGPERVIFRRIGVQLLQLRAAIRSPGAANEHEDGGPTAEHIGEPKDVAVADRQRE